MNMSRSYHESVEEMYKIVKESGLTNVFDRYEKQKNKCIFCMQGLSCQLCSMGPCRIMKNTEYGACGIDANAMAMRNMLHRHILGASAYTHHAIEAIKTLKAVAENKSKMFDIKDKEKLIWFAKKLGIKTEGRDIKEIAMDVANFIWEDLHRYSQEESKLVEIFAPEKRKRIWKELGIFPGGVLHEILDAATSSMTNIDTNYISLAKKGMRLAIATCLACQLPLEIIQDILFGTPKPHEAYVDLGIIDPEYVNIAVNGHEPFVAFALLEYIKREDVQEAARKVGAKGVRIIGSIETGQEMIQRIGDKNFSGLVGNWIFQEFLLATGAIDVFATDMNCTLPSLKEYADKYNFEIIPVNRLVRLRGVDSGLDYKPENIEEIVREIVNRAIENFKRRKKNSYKIPDKKKKIIAGFSIEVIEGVLDKVLDYIVKGDIKGIVALVSCTTLRNGPHDYNTVTLAKELIKRNILILSMGCGNAALQVSGLTSLEAINLAGNGLRKACNELKIPPVLSFGTCTDTGRVAYLARIVADKLNVDIPDLPVVASAPEYMEQKATIDAIFAIAYGLTVHVSPIPPVTGAKDLVKLLTEDVERLTGGKLILEDNPIKAAEIIENVIVEKRKRLNLST